jgi:hypothetical protein
MRTPIDEALEPYRIRTGNYASRPGDPWGAFKFDDGMAVMANPAHPESRKWEHVSVSFEDRTPTWEEMCRVKNMFWLPEEAVVQYHPPESVYVNCHPHCLHLWRPTRHKDKLPLPPSLLIGPMTAKAQE